MVARPSKPVWEFTVSFDPVPDMSQKELRAELEKNLKTLYGFVVDTKDIKVSIIRKKERGSQFR